VDGYFNSDCKAIYDSYSAYHQSQGQEQRVFEQSQGCSQFRSEALLSKILEYVDLPSKGRLLDIGCGNGNLLRSFSKLRPHWTFVGLEFNDKYKQAVEQIANVEAFYCRGIEEVAGSFNLITMLHCLEHISDPINFLRKLQTKISCRGLLLAEVPDYTQNPFDLIVADHCSHFDVENLKAIFHAAGVEVIIAANDYVPKELTFLARKSKAPITDKSPKRQNSSYENVVTALQWLERTTQEALKIAKRGKFGLFGTSIAGTWLCQQLGDAVSFFVDEDRSRIGKEFMNRKVCHPTDLTGGSNVLIALPFPIAVDISHRLKAYNISLHLPPEP
jgi:2-polyprenyl-3-methyl-5-hydroxy-6-metoxy-1,4-benzoquinol methylase